MTSRVYPQPARVAGCDVNTKPQPVTKEETMQAFVDSPVTKGELLTAVATHRVADRLKQGVYYSPTSGKGCAVGCTLHDFKPGHEAVHDEYRELFHVPPSLAWLEDVIFENLPLTEAQEWPTRFVLAIPQGADFDALDKVTHGLCAWLLLNPHSPLRAVGDLPLIRQTGEMMVKAFLGEDFTLNDWKYHAHSNYTSAQARMNEAGTYALESIKRAEPYAHHWAYDAAHHAARLFLPDDHDDDTARHCFYSVKMAAAWWHFAHLEEAEVHELQFEKKTRAVQEDAARIASRELLNQLQSCPPGIPSWLRVQY